VGGCRGTEVGKKVFDKGGTSKLDDCFGMKERHFFNQKKTQGGKLLKACRGKGDWSTRICSKDPQRKGWRGSEGIWPSFKMGYGIGVFHREAGGSQGEKLGSD